MFLLLFDLFLCSLPHLVLLFLVGNLVASGPCWFVTSSALRFGVPGGLPSTARIGSVSVWSASYLVWVGVLSTLFGSTTQVWPRFVVVESFSGIVDLLPLRPVFVRRALFFLLFRIASGWLYVCQHPCGFSFLSPVASLWCCHVLSSLVGSASDALGGVPLSGCAATLECCCAH